MNHDGRKKTVVFRVDASQMIASGHLMRCLTLAHTFKKESVNVHFVSRQLPASYQAMLAIDDFTLHNLPAGELTQKSDGEDIAHRTWIGTSWQNDAQQTIEVLKTIGNIDLLVVDHYGIDANWEETIHRYVKKLFVIDDLADRPHACDVLLDQNYYYDRNPYAEYLKKNTLCFIGPRYALIRPEFKEAREKCPRNQRPQKVVKKINICFGGVDAKDDTHKALEALKPWRENKTVEIDIILTKESPHRASLQELARQDTTLNLHIAPTNIAMLLAEADLSIGASGAMIWERACVGLPSIAISTAKNQYQRGHDAGLLGMHVFLGETEQLSVEQLYRSIQFLMDNPEARQSFADLSLKMTDGLGAARIAQQCLLPEIKLRKCVPEDCQQIYEWRTAFVTRRYSHNGEVFPYAEHEAWFSDVMQSAHRHLLIGEDARGPVGVVRFDLVKGYWLISIYLVPNRHGEKLGSALLQQGMHWINANHNACRKVVADILDGNIASQIIFERAGFKKQFSTYVADLT